MTEPYYSDDAVTIYHGDCLEILPTIHDVGLVFTSPPYNLGTSTGEGMHAGSLAAKSLAGGYESYDDARPVDEYASWQVDVVQALWMTLSDVGAIFYNHKPRVQAGELILPLQYGIGLPLRQIITWDRGTGLNFSPTFFLPKSEWIIVWAKSGWKLTSRDACLIGDVWHVRPEQGTDHPAPFPVELPQMAIGSTDAKLILDPFMGSGTTLRAAKNLGRKAVGIELEERYCEIAAKRCAQEVLFA